MHTQKHACKNTHTHTHNPPRSQLLGRTTLGFIYQIVFERAYVWDIKSCVCARAFLLCAGILGRHLIIMHGFILTGDELESQPTLRGCFMRLSKRIS